MSDPQSLEFGPPMIEPSTILPGVDAASSRATIIAPSPPPPEVSMIGVKAIVLPFFEFLAPYRPTQPLYLIPELAPLLCLAEVIVARDSDTGEEMPVWGTEEYERLKIGESTVRGPVLVVELSFANELEDLLDVVTAVQGASDLDDEEEGPADDSKEAENDEDLDDEDDEDLEDADDDFDDEWDEVGDEDDEDNDAEDEEDEEPADEK